MACGHAADDMTNRGEIYCSACMGDTLDAMKAVEIPNVTRWARCMSCEASAFSEPNLLPFFTYRDGEEEDRYWCGCGPA